MNSYYKILIIVSVVALFGIAAWWMYSARTTSSPKDVPASTSGVGQPTIAQPGDRQLIEAPFRVKVEEKEYEANQDTPAFFLDGRLVRVDRADFVITIDAYVEKIFPGNAIPPRRVSVSLSKETEIRLVQDIETNVDRPGTINDLSPGDEISVMLDPIGNGNRDILTKDKFTGNKVFRFFKANTQ